MTAVHPTKRTPMDTTTRQLPTLLTARQAAEYLGIRVQTLYDWRYKGTGPRSIKAGGSIRYSALDLLEWIERSTEDGARDSAARNSVSGKNGARAPKGGDIARD